MTSPIDARPLHRLPAALPLQEAQRVLVLAPHPDDECIGCGGLIAALVQRQVPVKVVLVTDGGGAGGLPPGAGQLRQQEFLAALAVLGVREHALLGLPDGGLHADAALCDAIAHELRAFEPDWLLTPALADAHRDHACVAAAARAAAPAQPGLRCLIEYETWSPAAMPSHALDISEQLPIKMAALAEHRTALACGNYLEATRGLASYRALLLGRLQPGAAAEAFMVLERASGFAAG